MRHGFYFRSGIDEKGTFYRDIPIIRFCCRREGPYRGIRDSTFSLLPASLIPYRRHSAGWVYGILCFWLLLAHSIEETLDYISEISPYLLLSPSSLYDFKGLFVGALNRLYTCPSICSNLGLNSTCSPLDTMLRGMGDYIYEAGGNPIRGPDGLLLDFYFGHGGYSINAPFLFGTPYQFRSIS